MTSTVRKQVHGSLFTHSETPPTFRVGLFPQLHPSGKIPVETPRGVFLW